MAVCLYLIVVITKTIFPWVSFFCSFFISFYVEKNTFKSKTLKISFSLPYKHKSTNFTLVDFVVSSFCCSTLLN